MCDDGDDCQLGRHDYWEQHYQLELANLQQLGDEGEVWFGANVQQAMLTFLASLADARKLDRSSAAVLDVGTGNAALLVELAGQGWHCLTGSDYSAASVALAAKVLQQRSVEGVTLVEDDLLHSSLASGSFKVITDKGTLDAIGLMPDSKQTRLAYKQQVHRLLQPEGLLVVTSCNSTQEELCQEFSAARQHSSLQYIDHVRTYPTFCFAGKTGTRVCTVAFQKQHA